MSPIFAAGSQLKKSGDLISYLFISTQNFLNFYSSAKRIFLHFISVRRVFFNSRTICIHSSVPVQFTVKSFLSEDIAILTQ